ncbi:MULTISPECIES: hypothetical protein [unclassified Aeromicrobium]|uniref:hypothetical protein n=1 Tax=unclassified Aeromicrobium TaxID=2633570 RepID=UPI0006FBC02B|nr:MULTISPECIES: hypothetical protein [unclassified Aeromicrobium]KQP79787.1 hypothetical protein ASF37_01895 [Aeromicrobium sp. Leaf289]KQP82129.1 hypothetical protein ASF35_11820 [Aeromicrobium sp. Leaf291]
MPAYLPDEDAWRYDLPPVSPGWRWMALLAPLVALAVAAAATFSLLHSLEEDERGYLDDPEVTGVVTIACAIMTSTVDGLRVGGPPRRQAAVLADQNLAVERMIDTVRRIDAADRRSDRPLDAWLEDWDSLLRARDRYARQVSTGFDATFRVPTGPDDRPVVERMDRAAEGTCRVPDVLVDPFSAGDQDV